MRERPNRRARRPRRAPVARRPDADRRDAHQRAVRLALGGVQAEEPALGGLADVDRAGLHPIAVGVEHLVALEAAVAQDRARERRAPSRCRRSAVRRWCGTAPPSRARARRAERAARFRSPVLNSTREPRLSPMTWPSSTPCARSSQADFFAESRARRAARGAAPARPAPSRTWRAARAACGAPAKHAAHARHRSCPAAPPRAPRRRAPRRSPRAMSAMPAATSYSLTLCIDTVATPSPAAMRAMR